MIKRPVFPILLAAWPTLVVFASNAGLVGPGELIAPLLATTAGFGGLLWLLTLALGSAPRAALLTGFLVLWVFGFGQFQAFFEAAWPDAPSHAAELGLACWSALLALVAGLTNRGARLHGEFAERMVPVLNGVSAVLVLMPLVTMLSAAGSTKPVPKASEPNLAPATGSTAPDIYYIVLDGFGAGEELRRLYEIDDSALLDGLRKRGFYVATESHANYLRTIQSLNSTLNMRYISKAAREHARGPRDVTPLFNAIRKNRLMATLERHGYAVYAFESGYAATDLRSAPGYLASGGGASEFHALLLSRSPIPLVQGWLGADDLHARHRERIRHTLSGLPDVASRPGPKFVFAHILAPHPPFVFEADGSAAPTRGPFTYLDGNSYLLTHTPDEYRSGYASQVRFLSRELLGVVDGILAASADPPVIVIQGDHGPGMGFHHERLGRSDVIERAFILNAYHLPGEARATLRPDITPVNSFRLILRHYLGEDLPPLPDRTFYNRESEPYDYRDVTTNIRRYLNARRAAVAP